MFATTIGSAMNQADAVRDQRAVANQQARDQNSVIGQSGVLNVAVGNAGVQVAVPANVCIICQ
jgi:hypothetical protein